MDIRGSWTPRDRDELLQQVMDSYRADPAGFRKALPEVAQRLDSMLSTTQQPHGGSESPLGITAVERESHAEALEGILRKSKSNSLTVEEAVQGLEHGAALLIDRFSLEYPPRQELLRLVHNATGIVPRKSGKPVEKVVAEGEACRAVDVVKGVELHLTWDLKLVKVTLDPRQWKLRGQALGFVGVASDSAADVAERHDDYLADAIQSG